MENSGGRKARVGIPGGTSFSPEVSGCTSSLQGALSCSESSDTAVTTSSFSAELSAVELKVGRVQVRVLG